MNQTHPQRLVPAAHRRGLVIDLTADELPCPWCGTPTDEDDTDCTGCGRHFG